MGTCGSPPLSSTMKEPPGDKVLQMPTGEKRTPCKSISDIAPQLDPSPTCWESPRCGLLQDDTGKVAHSASPSCSDTTSSLGVKNRGQLVAPGARQSPGPSQHLWPSPHNVYHCTQHHVHHRQTPSPTQSSDFVHFSLHKTCSRAWLQILVGFILLFSW